MTEEEQEPAPPKSIFEGCKLLTKDHFQTHSNHEVDKDTHGLVDALEVTKDKVTALYFSASWCPPCLQFTPLLKQIYGELSGRNAALQIVFISLDKTQEAMQQYYLDHHGKWLALPYEDPLKEKLIDKFNITAIPKLIVLHQDGDVITMKGRKEVQDKGIICFRSWLHAANLGESVSVMKVDEQSESSSGLSLNR